MTEVELKWFPIPLDSELYDTSWRELGYDGFWCLLIVEGKVRIFEKFEAEAGKQQQ
jgi:hypothetical protein